MYLTCEKLLSSPDLDLPEFIDHLTVKHRNVMINVYGVLHGLQGGTNKEYRSLVNKTIAQAKGLKFCEKGMKRIYAGLDVDVEDWQAMPLKDAFKLAFSLSSTPTRLTKLIWANIKEKAMQQDPFKKGPPRRLQDIGGSPAFHLMSPTTRRLICGFPSPVDYLHENIKRRKGAGELPAPIFPDKNWFWLSYIEPYANIPTRSIHMLEYAVEYAKQKGEAEISLFVGEIHNSDIAWLVEQNFEALTMEDNAEITKIIMKARRSAFDLVNYGKRTSNIAYVSALVSGMALPTCLYAIAVTLLLV